MQSRLTDEALIAETPAGVLVNHEKEQYEEIFNQSIRGNPHGSIRSRTSSNSLGVDVRMWGNLH